MGELAFFWKQNAVLQSGHLWHRTRIFWAVRRIWLGTAFYSCTAALEISLEDQKWACRGTQRRKASPWSSLLVSAHHTRANTHCSAHMEKNSTWRKLLTSAETIRFVSVYLSAMISDGRGGDCKCTRSLVLLSVCQFLGDLQGLYISTLTHTHIWAYSSSCACQ